MKKIFLSFLLGAYIIIFFSSFTFSKVLKVSSKLQTIGYTIVIDCGHGGKDNGASGFGVNEDDLNLEYGMTLKEELEKHQTHVVLTREGDYDLASEHAKNRKREDLKRRVEIIESLQPILYLSIHMNSYTSPSVHGAQVFYQSNNDLSKKLGSYIQKELNETTGIEKKQMSGNYYILENSERVGLLIEVGYMSNEEEVNLLQTEKYKEAICKAIVAGIFQYLDGVNTFII